MNSIQHAKERLKGRIQCQKYNYAMDEVVQNFCCYDGYIQLSTDEKELELWLKKPLESVATTRRGPLEEREPGDHQDQVPRQERAGEPVDYRHSKSSASCELSDIIGIIYGGLSSRFWMYRK